MAPAVNKCATSSLCGLPPSWHPDAHDQRLRDSLRAGISVGHDGRLRRMLRQLRSGADVVVTAVGASVTSDFAGVVGHMQNRFSLGYIGRPALCKDACVEPGWMLPVGDFLHQLGGGSAADRLSWAVANATAWSSASGRVPSLGQVLVVNAGNAGHGRNRPRFSGLNQLSGATGVGIDSVSPPSPC